MNEPGPSRVRLRVAARGYDRDEVDARLIENDRSAEEVQARLQDIEAELTEADDRARTLEAKLFELEQREDDGPSESIQWLHDVTDQILRVTSDDAHELMIKIENEAKVAKLEAERVATETIEAAEARAEEITQAARRDLDNATRMKAESHRQVDLYIDQGKAMANERSGGAWGKANDRLEEVQLERDRVERQCRAVRAELSHVRGTIEDLQHYLRGDGAAEA